MKHNNLFTLGCCTTIICMVSLLPFHVKAADLTFKHEGVACSACHTTGAGLPPPKAACVACHDENQLVKSTEHYNFVLSYFKDQATGKEYRKKAQLNPHDSFHYGRAEECINCHREHRSSTFNCARCHDTGSWNMKAPR